MGELFEVPGNNAGCHRRLQSVPSLTPDQEQRRAGPILPQHYHVRVEELEVEIAGRRSGERLIAIAVRSRPWRRRQLAQVGPPSLADERRRVHLRSEEHTSELQSRRDLVCRLLL